MNVIQKIQVKSTFQCKCRREETCIWCWTD